MTLDVYGHLWPNRLGEVAEAMETTCRKALAPLPPAPAKQAPVPAIGL
jgi:hypothetical protein